MAWQDELRALDEALAQGRISSDQHRVERDRILAGASGAVPGGGQHWQAMNPAPAAGQPDAERTQVVRGGADPNATVFVQAPRFPQQPQQQQHLQQQPPHFAPSPPMSPPWSDEQGTGFTSTGNWSQVRQGPEVFENTHESNTGKWVAVAIIVVLLGSAATWWFGFRETDTTAQPPTTSSAPTTQQPQPVAMADLPSPSGQPSSNTGEYNLDEAKAKKVVGEPEHKSAKDSGVTKVLYKSAVDQEFGYAVSGFITKDTTSASDLSDALVQQHTNLGMAPLEIAGIPKGVSVMKLTMQQPQQTLIRAVYVSGVTTIRVGVLVAGSVGEQAAADGFAKYLKQVLAAVPVK